MDLKLYKAAKASGTLATMKVGPATVLVGIPTFDPHTGAPAPVQFEQLNLQAIDEAIAPLQEQLAALQELRADVEKLLSVALGVS